MKSSFKVWQDQLLILAGTIYLPNLNLVLFYDDSDNTWEVPANKDFHFFYFWKVEGGVGVETISEILGGRRHFYLLTSNGGCEELGQKLLNQFLYSVIQIYGGVDTFPNKI